MEPSPNYIYEWFGSFTVLATNYNHLKTNIWKVMD